MPATSLAQTAIRDLFARQEGVDRLTGRLIRAAFDGAAIDRRATVITELGELDPDAAGRRDPDPRPDPDPDPDPDLDPDPRPDPDPDSRPDLDFGPVPDLDFGPVPDPDPRPDLDPDPDSDLGRARLFLDSDPGRARLFIDADRRVLAPTTGERNAVYRREAPALFAAAATDALARAGMAARDVTHVVTVSCTGFFAPGPDFRLVRDLGIPVTAERSHLGFMGCAAAFPGLRTAAHICDAQPGAVVLVVCAELCSLHLRASADVDQIVASAVFADGAAAAVVSSAAPRTRGPRLELDGFSTAITSEGESDMDWTIGDQGFQMVLTAEVPRIVGREIRDAVRVATRDAAPDAVDAWAVHPGGRSILDRVQSGLGLSDEAMLPSREVLREHGNMSSATVLFILQRLLADDALRDGATVVGIGFGPGLTVETARLVRRAG